ncbi:hypothetical protein HNY73_013540 [Argiope bruennichi]|uniref:Uncharacterized protein n=1 Tax=Argiope bruennichi TaxID=94029 RepID=A0A8T0EYD8_ARGBR|nr:hypothetical protein HNY73_013540 [Argiope bruennichi]
MTHAGANGGASRPCLSEVTPGSGIKKYKLEDVEIPRYFEINDTTQMHVFADACKEACATCTFLRSDTYQGKNIALVTTKARGSPLKKVTISILELMEIKKGKIENAEIRLIQFVQAQSLPDEKSIPNLRIFRDENDVIRVKTKLRQDRVSGAADSMIEKDLSHQIFAREILGIGDVIGDDEKKRLQWPSDLVIELISAKNGLIIPSDPEEI